MAPTPGTKELRGRVADAERLCAVGNWTGAFHAYAALVNDILLARGETGSFGYNDFLVTDRFADLAVQTGAIAPALDLFHVLHLEACDSDLRCMAAFKRLRIAVEAGDGSAAKDTLTWIVEQLWAGRLLDPLRPAALDEWERGVVWREPETLLAQLYLALGTLYNALRKLPESKEWLRRGLRHTKSQLRARLAAVPLHLALANHALTLGNLNDCDACLADARAAMDTVENGGLYVPWVDGLAARLAFTRGHLAEAAGKLAQVEEECRGRGLVRALCACLIARAEMFILLNLLEQTDGCLAEAQSLAVAEGLEDIRKEAARVQFFRITRARLFADLAPGEPVGGMQGEPSPGAAPQAKGNRLADDAVVWTGDCLRDFEIREAMTRAALDADAEASGAVRSAPRTEASLKALCEDFGTLESPLISARLHLLRGLVAGWTSQNEAARRELRQAFELFEGVGAESDLFQTALHLAWSLRKTDPARYSALLEENDRRLERLSDGLPTETRNAFELNKYRQDQELRRAQAEQILELRHRARNGPWWQRIAEGIRFRTKVHDFICELDTQQLKRRKFGDGKLPRRGIIGMARRIAFHNSGNQTVGYVALPDQTLVYSLRRWHLDLDSLRLGRLGIAEKVKNLQSEILKEFGSYTKIAHRMCTEIGLEDILGAAPARIDSLTILPGAELNLLPFAALRFVDRQNKKRYLVERFAVNIDDIAERRKAGIPVRPITVAAHFMSSGERELAQAGRLAEVAAQWWEKASKLPCARITEKSDCVAALPKAAAFYYFGHGHFVDGESERTGIEFPAGILSPEDLDPIDFSGLHQAVIFACHGGDARTLNGRWVVGIPQMLLRRGARSVLAAVWQPTEQNSAQLSSMFLDRAASAGRAQALREFQCAQLEKGGSAAQPYEWAPFQVYGEAGVLRCSGRKWVWRKSRVN